MSVPEQVPYKEYRATGSSNTFEITFYLPDPKDLVVMVNKEIPPVGAYSIVGDSVVFGVAPNEGDLVELTRDTQLDRETNFKSYDNSFRPETINFDLDKIWLVLQESNLVDAKILARLKQEIEWRRTHDFNYDELAQVREKQLFDALKGYTDTLNAATKPGVFQGVIAGVVFAQDGKSIQTHLEEILESLAQERENIDSKADQTYVEEQLDLKAPQETTYTKIEVDAALALKAPQSSTYTKAEVDTVFAAYVGGRKGFTTLALAVAAQSTLPVNTVVDVTNDPTPANNGTYQWDGTSLTKSDYDPLTQAKNYTDINFPKNRDDIITGTDIVSLQQVGEYLVPPSIELINAPTGRTSSREAVLSVSGIGTGNRYRKQEYSESVTGKRWFQIIDTFNNIVRRAWSEVGLSAQEPIAKSLSWRTECRVVASRTGAYTEEVTTAGLLKGLNQGEIIYESTTHKVHLPNGLTVIDTAGTSYVTTSAQSVGTTETDFGTHNLFYLFLSRSTLLFSLISYRVALTDAQKQDLILCATIRHDAYRLSITADALFRIDYAQYGEIISKYYADVYGAADRGYGNLPNYNTTLHQLELKKGTLIKFGNINYSLPADVVIPTNDPSETSSVIIVYFDLVSSSFIVKKYNTSLTINERFRLVKVAIIRDSAYNGNSAAGRDVLSMNINCQFTVDGIDSYAPQEPIPYRSMVRFVNVDDTVRSVNHGGYGSVAPTNSLEGYTASKAAGFRYVECDVKFTSDGVPILMHDETVDRTTNGTGAVRSMTLAQIKELRIDTHSSTYPDCRVPTLEEFLRHCHKLNLHPYIEWSEVNSPPTDADASLIAQIIRRTGMDGKVSLISMRTNKLAAVCKFMPHLRCGFTSSSEPTVARLTAVINEINVGSKGQNEIFYNCSVETLTQEYVNNCHDAGIGCETWVINTPSIVKEVASWGVTGISTDSLNIRAILDE